MKALRLVLFGIVLALFMLFAFSNWTRVPVTLPNGTIVAIFLPVVVFVAFLVGWVPTVLVHIASRATWRRRAARTDRLLEEALSSGHRTAMPAANPLPPLSPTVYPPTGA